MHLTQANSYAPKVFGGIGHLKKGTSLTTGNKDAACFMPKDGYESSFNWIQINERTFSPTKNAINFIGYAYRGDARSPDEIFKTGFLAKQTTDLNDDNFLESLETMRVVFNDTEPSTLFISMKQLHVNQDTAVCLSNAPHYAAFFPYSLALQEPTYVYLCLVTKGVALNDKAGSLSSEVFRTTLSESIGEIMTTKVPACHVVCAWSVKRNRKYLSGRHDVRVCYEPTFSNLKFNSGIDSCVKSFSFSAENVDLVETKKIRVIQKDDIVLSENMTETLDEDIDSDDSLYS